MTTMKEMEQFRRERDVHKRLTILKRKLQEMPFITEEESDAFQKAFKTKDHMDLSLAKEAFMEFPVVIAGPYLQDAGTDKMTVVWETDDNCAAHIQWGPDTKSPRGDAVESSRTINYANLTNLKPNTEYYYRVYSNKQYTRVYRFRTLPAEGPFTFTAWGDSQNAWETLEQLVTTMRPLATSFTLGLGDMVEEGSRQQPWLELLNTLQYFIAETPFFMIGGNHEYDGCFEKMRSFFLTRYAYNQPTTHFMAWTASNARFVAIDPNNHYPTRIPLESDQYKRLMLELESPEWKQATWRFIIIHQPPYSQGWTEYQGDIPIRELLEPLIEPHGIDFVLSGHTHDYEQLTRTYGKQTTHFFILGGAGDGIESGPLSEFPVMDKVVRRQHFGYFQVDGNRVTIQAISPDGEVFDTLEVEK